jgi:hypothetical protein
LPPKRGATRCMVADFRRAAHDFSRTSIRIRRRNVAD